MGSPESVDQTPLSRKATSPFESGQRHVTKNELIKVLEALPGNPHVFMWNGNDVPAIVTVADSAMVFDGGYIAVVPYDEHSMAYHVPPEATTEGATVVLDSRGVS